MRPSILRQTVITHIFDSYSDLAGNPKLTFALEGDYFIQRLWRNAAPSMSSAPSHVAGGAAYAQYQINSKFALATRFEYMSDPEGLFSGIDQALKENTVTFDYKVTDGLLMRYEWRRDYSNQPTFLSDVPGHSAQGSENTGHPGRLVLVWWGRKRRAGRAAR